MARDFAIHFYRSKQWQSVRQLALMRDAYLCQLCGKPAEEVHHITHLSPENIGDPNVSLNLDNLMCLCRDCHFKVHENERVNAAKRTDEAGEEYGFDENGYLVRVNGGGGTPKITSSGVTELGGQPS